MKGRQLLGVIGAVLILVSGIIPLAALDNKIITYIPIWNNFNLENGLWQWRDIGFFALTLFIVGVLSIYFSVRKIFPGLIVTGCLALFIIFILFMAIFEIKSKLNETFDAAFSFGWGWIILLLGTIFILFSGAKKSKSL